MDLNQIHNRTCLDEDCCMKFEKVEGTEHEFKFKDISMIAGDFTKLLRP